MEPKDMTLEQLKVLAYDQIALGQNAQSNLNIINQEIAKRTTESSEKVAPKEKTTILNA